MLHAYLYLVQSSRMKAMRLVRKKINDVAVAYKLNRSNPARIEGSGAVDHLAVPIPVHEPRADS